MYYFASNCRRSNKMHQGGGELSRFLKMGGGSGWGCALRLVETFWLVETFLLKLLMAPLETVDFNLLMRPG